MGTIAWLLTLLCSPVEDVILLGLHLCKESRKLCVANMPLSRHELIIKRKYMYMDSGHARTIPHEVSYM